MHACVVRDAGVYNCSRRVKPTEAPKRKRTAAMTARLLRETSFPGFNNNYDDDDDDADDDADNDPRCSESL